MWNQATLDDEAPFEGDEDDAENLEDYDQEQEESEETEESDDSAPHFSQIKHLLK